MSTTPLGGWLLPLSILTSLALAFTSIATVSPIWRGNSLRSVTQWCPAARLPGGASSLTR